VLALGQAPAHGRQNRCNLTVLVPAYNEGNSLADTIRSLQTQTLLPEEIVVIDDFSTDDTGDVARALGVTVIRPPANTGSKAGAQNFALGGITTEYTMAIDADTTLAPNAIEKLSPAFEDPNVAAACGFVLPRYVKTLWERGRYIEYMLAFTWYKPIQDYYQKPMISSGCFSMYRTRILKEHGGWQTRTLAEDMDLTWSLHAEAHGVRFIPEAVSYPIEPHDYGFLSKQLKRWSHGFMQNVKLHWVNLLGLPYLGSFVAVALCDAIVASLAYLVAIPLLALVLWTPWPLLAYILDAPIILVPVMLKAVERKEKWQALVSVPCFLVLRLVNSYFVLAAFFQEFVLRKSFLRYEKGH
jgi:biofilm PGA synthesis N-glycosyltransferase PgaC